MTAAPADFPGSLSLYTKTLSVLLTLTRAIRHHLSLSRSGVRDRKDSPQSALMAIRQRTFSPTLCVSACIFRCRAVATFLMEQFDKFTVSYSHLLRYGRIQHVYAILH